MRGAAGVEHRQSRCIIKLNTFAAQKSEDIAVPCLGLGNRQWNAVCRVVCGVWLWLWFMAKMAGSCL
jgi:hypothetical protein